MVDVSDKQLRAGFVLGFICAALTLGVLFTALSLSGTRNWQALLEKANNENAYAISQLLDNCDLEIAAVKAHDMAKFKAAKFDYKRGIERGRRVFEKIMALENGQLYLDTDTRTQWNRFDDQQGRHYLSFVVWPTDDEVKVLKRFTPAQMMPQNPTQQQQQAPAEQAQPKKEEKK